MARWEYKVIPMGPNVKAFPRPSEKSDNLRLLLEGEQAFILNGWGQADWELVTIDHGFAYMKRHWAT